MDEHDTFDRMCVKLKIMEPVTIHEFAHGMKEISNETYMNSWIKYKLVEKYGANIAFSEKEGTSDIIN